MELALLISQHLFLHYMRSVQRQPGDKVAVDLFTASLSTPKIHDRSGKVKILSDRWRPDLENLLKALEQKGCIEFVEEESETCIYNIVYDYTHEVQRLTAVLGSFLLKSILVPIAVSLLTALVTLRLFR